MSDDNVEIVRRVWDSWERGDRETIFALFDPAIVLDQSAVPGPTAGVYHGHVGIRQAFREWLESFEAHQARAETFIDAGETVVVGHRLKARGKTSGAEVEMPRWHVYRIRDGLVVRIEVFETEADALKAAGTGEYYERERALTDAGENLEWEGAR